MTIGGFIDQESKLGMTYKAYKSESAFYNVARFYSVSELQHLLTDASFEDLNYAQTLFHSLQEIRSIEPVYPGHGKGAFVVLRCAKPSS